MTLRTASPLAIAALVLPGCWESIDEAIEEHGGGARATLTAVQAVAAAMPAQPRLTASRVDAVPPLRISLGGLDRANAAVVHEEDLVRLGELGAVEPRLHGSETVPECASFLEHRTHPWDPLQPGRWDEGVAGYEVTNSLALCGRLTHLLVVRVTEIAVASEPRIEPAPPPSAGAPAASASPSAPAPSAVSTTGCAVPGWRCTFDRGWIDAEVHVWALAPVRHLGGFTVTAENREKVRMSTVNGGPPVMLRGDLGSALDDAMRAAIRQHLPGAQPL